MNRGLWLGAVACVSAAYGLYTSAYFTQGELILDEAATFFVAVRSLRDVLTLPVSFQAQPPLFYLVLHEWLRFGDAEPWLRVLPLVFMVLAGVTLLLTSWLTRLTRVVSLALLLLTSYGGYLTSFLRPYSLAVWLSLWSCLLFFSLLVRPGRRVASYVWFVVVSALMAYSVAMTSWILVAEGLCAVAAVGLASAENGVRRSLEQYRGLLLSLAALALIYLPYVVSVWFLQRQIGAASFRATLAAATNVRYYVSGPVFLLAMPAGLGYVALAAVGYAAWIGARRRDPLIGVLMTVVVVQIGLTHGILAGRSDFAFRYLAPAYPALCLLVGLGADRLFSRFRGTSLVVAACAACVLAAAAVAFARAPHQPPVGPWRQVGADLVRLPGSKVVFFDIGWDAQRLQYEVRHDPDVRVMSNPGTGWGTGGREMTNEYVTRLIHEEAGPTTMFFYEFDPVWRSAVFDEAFAPAMSRQGCARVYQRDVPTYTRSVPGDAGAVLYGYVCHAS